MLKPSGGFLKKVFDPGGLGAKVGKKVGGAVKAAGGALFGGKSKPKPSAPAPTGSTASRMKPSGPIGKAVAKKGMV